MELGGAISPSAKGMEPAKGQRQYALQSLDTLANSTGVVGKLLQSASSWAPKINRALDGDTVVISAPFLPAPLKPELAVRIYGVDTPEKGFRAQCPQEDERGKLATKFATNAVAKSTKRQVILYGWDKFGGRVLGDIILDGQSLRAGLIQNGFAREYFGEAKQSWCN
jgi:endonuclease YncB( thermonuclease family)